MRHRLLRERGRVPGGEELGGVPGGGRAAGGHRHGPRLPDHLRLPAPSPALEARYQARRRCTRALSRHVLVTCSFPISLSACVSAVCVSVCATHELEC
eukprot:2481586-Rhodomonas_salina.1